MRIVLPLAALSLAGCQQEPAEPSIIENAELATPGATQNPMGPAEPGANSVYTSLDEAGCPLIEEKRDEGPYWRRRCPGAGGHLVEWTESDLRQGLELVKGSARTDLELSSIVAKGAFNRLGPRIEWRGKDAADPAMLTVRVFVANGQDPSRPDRSLLAVAKLRPTPCVVAVVPPGPQQNDKARDIADGAPKPCIG